MDVKTLFKLTNDEFVNESIAELVNQSDLDDSKISRTDIKGNKDDLQSILDLLTDAKLYSNTHRRTSDTRYLNAYANKTGNTVDSSDEPFPDDEKKVSGGEITESYLDNLGVSVEDFPNSSSSIYSKNPYYIGASIERGWSTTRVEKYKDIFSQVLFSSEPYDTDHSCRCCGRSDLPNWKFDGENIDYNQSFAPSVTKSGMTDLGQKNSQDSNYRGRCVACLVAGFAYSLIQKPVYTINPGEYRIYCFKSDFKSLVSIREAYESGNLLSDFDSDFNSDDPSKYSKTLPSNLPCQSKSDEAQLFTLLSKLNKATLEEKPAEDPMANLGSGVDKQLVQFISGATAFTSKNSKGGNPVRGITSISSVSFNESVAFYLQPITYDSTEFSETTYYPHQLVQYLSSISSINSDRDFYPQMVGRFVKGLLSEDISLIESGIFGLAKSVINEDAVVNSGISLIGTNKYIKMVFRNMTELTENELEALSSVGDSLGQLFDTRDDVSVLISLKNSNQLDQFLTSLERAGMESMKKSVVRGDSVPRYSAIREDDLAETLQILSDEEKFDSAKKVIVTHASFASLYQNSSSNNSDNNSGD